MDVEVLRWFQLAAEGMTVTEVAERVYISQSGVSRALARLEAEIGTPLLERSGRVLKPTRAGVIFKTRVDEMLSSLDDGLAEVARSVNPDSGLVSVGFQQSLAAWLVPDLVRTFRSTHPAIRFVLTQIVDDENPAMHGSDTDVELSTRRIDGSTDSFVVVTEPLVLAVPRQHRLTGRRRTFLADVADDPFVTLKPEATLRRLGDDLCLRAGYEPLVVFEGDDLATVRGLVSAGLGIAIVPAPRTDAPDSGLSGAIRYCDIADPGAEREIRLSWRAAGGLLPPARAFRDHIVTRVGSGCLPALAVDRSGDQPHPPSI